MEREKETKATKKAARQRHPVAERQAKMVEKMVKNAELLYRKSVKLASLYEKTGVDSNQKLIVINMAAALLKFKKGSEK